ncbi:MAG: RodZ domain-containing protein [Pseudomonadota bacterium]
MSEEGLGIGATLRAAREEKGWTIQDVGIRLRLMARQIEAIEAEDFSRLGQPVFARGFVRNYAKLLGLDPNELLEQMTRVKLPTVRETESVPFTPSQEFWKSPWVLGGIAAVVLAVAIPLGLYWWLTSDAAVPAPAAVEQSVPPPAPPPAPVLAGQTALPAPEQSVAAAAQAGEPQAQAAETQGAAAQPVAAQPQANAASVPTTDLRLQFDDISWVQVRDSSGRIVHTGLNPAGTAVDIEGEAPFYLVVGNAAKVQVLYKGRAIDLKPYTSVDVARLTLNP